MLDLGSIAVGLFGGAGGTLVVERYRHRNDLRRRGAAVLGPIFAMLIEADPDRLAISAGEHSRAQLQDLWRRAAEHDSALQTLAIELPGRAGENAAQLATAIHRSLNSSSWLVTRLLDRSGVAYDVEKARDEAVAQHTEARELAERLRDALRR